MAKALATLAKFTVKKKAGEGNKIFGSVSAQDVADAIEGQTSRKLDKSIFTLPDVKELGTYDVTAQLHPEVVGSFQLVVAKE